MAFVSIRISTALTLFAEEMLSSWVKIIASTSRGEEKSQNVFFTAVSCSNCANLHCSISLKSCPQKWAGSMCLLIRKSLGFQLLHQLLRRQNWNGSAVKCAPGNWIWQITAGGKFNSSLDALFRSSARRICSEFCRFKSARGNLPSIYAGVNDIDPAVCASLPSCRSHFYSP